MAVRQRLSRGGRLIPATWGCVTDQVHNYITGNDENVPTSRTGLLTQR